MARDDRLKEAMKDMKRAVKDAAREAAASGEGANVNLVARRNVVVSSNVGGEGETHSASATQTTRIRQQNGRTHEDTAALSDRPDSGG